MTAVIITAAVACAMPSLAAGAVAGHWSGQDGAGRADFIVSHIGGSTVLSDLIVRCASGAVSESDAWSDAGPGDRYEAAIGPTGKVFADYSPRPGVYAYTSQGVRSGVIGARRGRVNVTVRGAPGQQRCVLRDLPVSPQPFDLHRDGTYQLTGPGATGNDVYVYGQGVVIDLFGGLWGTPIGVPDPEAPELTCAELKSTAGSPQEFVFPSATGVFAAAFPYVPLLGALALTGKFAGSKAAAGGYIAQSGITFACTGAGAFAMTLRKPAPALRPAFPQPGARHGHHHPPRSLRYVALGDSFTSGEGVAPYQTGTDTARDRCHRSTRAYSQLVARPGLLTDARLRPAVSYACSGATTADLLSAERYHEPPQVDHPALGRAQVVTLTIGGNDAGFSSVLAACSRLTPGPCWQGKRAAGILARIKGLGPRLAATYEAVRRRAAPKARIVVLDYPNLFPARGCGKVNTVFTTRSQQFIRRAGGILDETIRDAARRGHVHFVDIRPTFAKHELCARHEWVDFLVAPRLRRPTATVGSFHPNVAGQAAYARILLKVLHNLI